MDAVPVLKHIVETVVPDRCRSAKSEAVGQFYESVTKGPAWAIERCAALVQDWVIEGVNTGKLWDEVEYVCLIYPTYQSLQLASFPSKY